MTESTPLFALPIPISGGIRVTDTANFIGFVAVLHSIGTLYQKLQIADHPSKVEDLKLRQLEEQGEKVRPGSNPNGRRVVVARNPPHFHHIVWIFGLRLLHHPNLKVPELAIAVRILQFLNGPSIQHVLVSKAYSTKPIVLILSVSPTEPLRRSEGDEPLFLCEEKIQIHRVGGLLDGHAH